MWSAALAVGFASACTIDREGRGLERIVDASPRDARRDAPEQRDADAARPDVDSMIDASDAEPVDADPNDASPPSPFCPDDPALVGCWPFDGDTLDHGPRGNHLEATDVVLDGDGVTLGPASGLVRAPRPELFHTVTSFDAWVRVDAPPAFGRSGIVDHNGQFGVFVHPGGELRCTNVVALVGAIPIASGLWHHVACAQEEDGRVTLYLDGIPIASEAAAPMTVPFDTPLQLGENAPTGDDQLIGAIDDARLWGRARGAAEIAADFARGRL